MWRIDLRDFKKNKTKQEKCLEATAVQSAKNDSDMDNGGSRRAKDKWTDKGDIFEVGLARLDAWLGSMYISDARCVRDREESQGCF